MSRSVVGTIEMASMKSHVRDLFLLLFGQRCLAAGTSRIRLIVIYTNCAGVRQHPQDCSVMTYRGHSVLNTLIRVHFSPPHITGHRYIASGSSDGRIHVWNLDGTIAQVINRSKTVPLVKASRPSRSGLETKYLYNDPYDSPERSKRTTPQPRLYGYDSMTVRDVSWNPNEPVLISTSWGGSCSVGSLALHPFMPHAKRLRVDPTIS